MWKRERERREEARNADEEEEEEDARGLPFARKTPSPSLFQCRLGSDSEVTTVLHAYSNVPVERESIFRYKSPLLINYSNSSVNSRDARGVTFLITDD